MSRKLLQVLVLSVSLTALGQTSAPPDQNNANANQEPNPPAQTVVPPVTGGTVWTGIGPAGGVLLSTPSATFDTPQPTAGISLAGRAGITNSTPLNTGLQSSLSPSSMVYVYTPAVSAPVANPAIESPALEAVPSERAPDLVPPAAFGTSPTGNNLSLAEVAAMYKARRSTQTLRTYTNADVPRENAGLLTNITMASNRMPEPPQNATTQSSTAPASTAQSPSSSTEKSTQSAGTESSEPTQNQATDENKRLPASSTLLPLLGLLGIASVSLGAWYRRRNR